MSVERRTLKQSTRQLAFDEATHLYERPSVSPRPPAQPERRLPRVPAYVCPEQDISMRAAEAALKQKPRRGRYLFTCVFLALVLLDGLAIGRIAGWWEPTKVMPQSSVPGIFVPWTLRVTSYGAPKIASAQAQAPTVQQNSRRPRR